jgi:S1-C subfamily serine protease
MVVSLPGPEEVRLVPRPFTGARYIVDEDSPAYAAGLRRGDVGIAMDGTDFDGPRRMDALYWSARLKTKTRLAFLRAGERMELDLDLSQVALRWDYVGR